jgi:hypothetical protein
MAGATLSTLDKILKDFYLPPVAEQLNNTILLMQRLESRSEEIFGKQAVVAVHKQRNAGVGVASDGGALPTAGNQGYDRAVYDLKYLYGRVQVTGPSMAKTASEAGAFLRALKSELDGIRQDLRKDLARQAYGSKHGNGLIEKCGATSASTTVVLNSAEALRKGHIQLGMKIDIGTAADPDSIAEDREVTAVNLSTPSITIDGAAVTTTTSHFVSRANNGLAEITGLQEIVADATGTALGGLDPDTAGSEYWDNQRLMNSGTPRAISVTLMAQAMSLAGMSDAEISLICSTFGIQRSLFELLQQSQRFVNTQEFKGGFTALDWQGKPFVADQDAPFGKVHFLQESDLKVFATSDWRWLDEDGHVLKWVTGYDAWEAVLARYLNLGAVRRNRCLVLGDITDTAGY